MIQKIREKINIYMVKQPHKVVLMFILLLNILLFTASAFVNIPVAVANMMLLMLLLKWWDMCGISLKITVYSGKWQSWARPIWVVAAQ